MRKSLYFRTFFVVSLIMLVSFTLLGTLSAAWSYGRSISEKRALMSTTLYETAKYVTAQHVYYGIDLNDLNMNMRLAFTSAISGFDLMITDNNGVIMACSEMDLRNLNIQISQELLQDAVANARTVRMTTIGEDICLAQRHVIATPLTDPDYMEAQIFGYLFVSSNISVIIYEWQTFSGMIILVALGMMILALLITFLATRKIAAQVNNMANIALRFSRGDFSVRIKDSGKSDEMGQLTQAFNLMADSFENAETLRRDFMANLSHEFKTPMTVISGFAEGLLDGTIPKENEQQYLSKIASETRRLSTLVKNMMELASIQAAPFDAAHSGHFDISETVRLALIGLDKKIESRKLLVETNLPEEPIRTRGDSDAISKVVHILIDNAIKFSETGSSIRLELWKKGALVYVSVENNGETISEDELLHIFNQFHKSDKSRGINKESVGLGLYMAKTILDYHNQDIFVESQGGTTKFVFTLTLL